MGRPKSTGENKTHQQHVLMTPTEVLAIDDWRFRNRIGSRGEAIRRLCQIGLTSDDTVEALKVSFEQMVRLLGILREFNPTDATGAKLETALADALILILGEATRAAIPALTLRDEGEIQLRIDAKQKLLARLKALDLRTEEGSVQALQIGAWFLNEIGALEGEENPVSKPVDLE